MSTYAFATAQASSVGGQGMAALAANYLMANMDKPIEHVHGMTAAAMDQALGMMATMEAADKAVGGVSSAVSAAAEAIGDAVMQTVGDVAHGRDNGVSV